MDDILHQEAPLKLAQPLFPGYAPSMVHFFRSLLPPRARGLILPFFLSAASAWGAEPYSAPPLETKFNLVVDAYDTFNFTNNSNTVNGSGNPGLVHNPSDSHPSLALAEFALSASQGEGSARFSLIYGQAADYLIGNPGMNPWEATLSYQPGPWKFTLGRMVTHMGYELIESPNNWNYSRCLLFQTVPTLHTGLAATYGPDERFHATAYYYDNWDGLTGISPGEGKSYGLQLQFDPEPAWHIVLNGLTGALAGYDAADGQTVAECILVLNAFSDLSLALDAEIGGWKDPSLSGAVKDYMGFALYGRWQAAEGLGLALRLEQFKDNQNTFMLYNAAAVPDLEGREITLTLERSFTPNVLGRLEGRYDEALSVGQPLNVFAGGSSPSQTTVTAGVAFSL